MATVRIGFRGVLRAGVKGLAVGVWTLAAMASLSLSWAPSLLATRRAAIAWRAATRRRALRAWSRGTCRLLGLRVAVQGPRPPAGAFLVSNHLSYLDVVALASAAPVVFVSKAEVRRWPLWGAAAALGGTVFVDRTRRRDVVGALTGMREALNRGDRVLVFPEATSTKGDTILPFKSALLDAAAAQGRPVHWAVLSYRTSAGDPPAEDRVCWWGDVGFVAHAVGLLALRRIDGVVRFGSRPVASDDRKALARTLRAEMLRVHLDGREPPGPSRTGGSDSGVG